MYRVVTISDVYLYKEYEKTNFIGFRLIFKTTYIDAPSLGRNKKIEITKEYDAIRSAVSKLLGFPIRRITADNYNSRQVFIPKNVCDKNENMARLLLLHSHLNNLEVVIKYD